MPSCKIDIRNTTIKSFAVIAIAIIFFAIDYCTTVTELLFYVILLISITYVNLWRLLTDEKFSRQIIDKEIESYGSDPEFFFMRWFPELEDSLRLNSEVKQDQYISLILRFIEKNEYYKNNKSASLEKRICDVFNIACFELGFVDAFRKIIYLNNWDNKRLFDSDKIAFSLISRIQYCTANEIDTYRIQATIEDIIERMDVGKFEKIRFAYGYFRAIKANEIIPLKVRDEILNSIIEKLSYLRDDPKGYVRSSILLLIFQDYILENENIGERLKIFQMVINNLHNENRYSNDKCYISTISQIFRATYFYSFLETETLSEDYRESLKQLFTYSLQNKNRSKVSLTRLLDENQKDVVQWLSENAVVSKNSLGLFDYFPENFFCKTSTWTIENLLRFAFYYYVITGCIFSVFPVDNYIGSDVISFPLQEIICVSITSLFENHVLCEDVKSEIINLQKALNKQGNLPESLLAKDFDYYNDWSLEIKTTISKLNISRTLIKLERINQEIVQHLENMSPFVYDSKLPMDNCHRLIVRPSFTHIYKNQIEIAVQQKLYEIKAILNQIIQTVLPPVELDFGMKGVRELQSKLTENIYFYRNYSYTDDFTIKKEVHVSPEFKDLVDTLKSIPLFDRHEWQHNIFLKDNKISFNVEVSSFDLKEPPVENCEIFIQQYKIADGKYQIDGVVMDFQESIKFIQNNYRIQTSEIKVATNLTSDSGFRIKFVH